MLAQIVSVFDTSTIAGEHRFLGGVAGVVGYFLWLDWRRWSAADRLESDSDG